MTLRKLPVRSRLPLAVLTASVICLRCIAGVGIPLPVLSGLCVLLTVLCLSGKPAVSLPLAAMLGLLLLSLALHPEPDFPVRAMRMAALTVGLVCFSPLVSTQALTRVRRVIARTLFTGLSLGVCASFLIWLYLTVTAGTYTHTSFSYFGFTGIFGYGMLLSSVSAVVCIAATWKFFRAGSRGIALVMALLAAVSFVCCVAGGSRMALMALLLSLAAILLTQRQRLRDLSRKPAFLTALLLAVILTAVCLPGATTALRHKINVSQQHESLFYSRRQLWQTRTDEFLSSPLLGIGFANEFPIEDPITQRPPGSIEPGSSWLTVLTYGGILTAIPFLWFMWDTVRKLLRRRGRPEYPLLLALLIFFLLNGVTEGWLFFAGSLMFPLFWLTCAAIQADPECKEKQ